MCLYVNKRIKLKFVNGRRICWKVLVSEDKNLYSPIYGKKYKHGWIKSNYIANYHGSNYGEYCDQGIHVHLTLASAKNASSFGTIIVPVICYEKDFVAAGSSWISKKNAETAKNREAVFKKVFLRKKDYEKAVKNIT